MIQLIPVTDSSPWKIQLIAIAVDKSPLPQVHKHKENNMKITDAKWQEIIAATRTAIDNWNAHARKHNVPDTFHMEVKKLSGGADMLMTEHHTSWKPARKLVVRTKEGELRPATSKKAKGGSRITIKGQDPKGWNGLADKPAMEIVGRLKLNNFVMIRNVRTSGMTKISSSGRFERDPGEA
jgi:hypothetical protein